jgi:LacI family transcriptional regulator, repressor for deo operon, udp, cdd, tsx, nupC, and nupG
MPRERLVKRQPSPPANIRAVARLAGVSTATVSRALRGLSYVSPPTRARVLAAAEELDYVVSPSASRLASGQTRSVGVVTPYIGRHFFAQVLSGAEAVLREAGYDVLLYALPEEQARAGFFEELPLRRRVDAVLVITLPLSEAQMDKLRALEVPLGVVGSIGVDTVGASRVGIDDTAGARTAVNHLVNLGHERIAMIGGGVSNAEPNPFTTPEDRRVGYRLSLTDAGLTWYPDYEVDGRYTTTGGEQAMGGLLGLEHPPTAVFAQSDRMAVGAMHALRRAGLSCPEDVSIIGFDDHEVAAPLDLTTIAQPMAEQGALAAEQILSALEGGEPQVAVLPTRLVLRSSTSPPRRKRRSK